MPTLHDIVTWGKNQLVFFTGRGLMTLGLVAALSAGVLPSTGLGAAFLAIGIFAGVAAMQTFVTWRNQLRGERQLTDLFRNEVAAALEIDPQTVTIAQLKEVAGGNPETGLPGNSVLQQAIENNEKRHLLRFISSGISALTILGVVGLVALTTGNNILEAVGDGVTAIKDTLGLGSFLGNATLAIGALTVAGSGTSLLNQVFDQAGSRIMGLNKVMASDLILDIKRDLAKGRMISEEQVFGVYVATQPELARKIEQTVGKSYFDLTQRRQHLVMERFSAGMDITQTTYDINHYIIEPEELAFKVVGQESGVPRAPAPDFEQEMLRDSKEKAMETQLARAIVGEPEFKDNPQTIAANNNQKHFAVHYVPREKPVSAASDISEKHVPDASQSRGSFVQRYAKGGEARSPLQQVIDELRARHETADSPQR